MSTRKPRKFAACVSPIEAVKYNGESNAAKTIKLSKGGGKVHRMAFSNLSRNKKRTVVTILSLSLSLVLLNTVFTISNGFDMDKYLEKFVDTDFLVGHANYFNLNGFRTPTDAVSETMIEQIEAQDGFLEGGKLYFNTNLDTCSIDQSIPEGELVNKANDPKPMIMLYGLDALPLSRIDVYEGVLDLKKLATGKYIIEGAYTDDVGNVHAETSRYSIGDKVTLNLDATAHEFEVLCKMKVSINTNSARFSIGNSVMYLPSETYEAAVHEPTVMSYAYNVKEGADEQMEKFIRYAPKQTRLAAHLHKDLHKCVILSNVKNFSSSEEGKVLHFA